MDDIDREYPRRRRSRDIPPDRTGDLPPRSRPIPRQDRQDCDIPRRNYGSRAQRNTDHLKDRYISPYDDDDEYEYETRPRRRQSPQRSRRKRSFLPAFLAGCTTAIICIVLAAAAFVFYTLRLMPGNTPIHIPGFPGMHPFTQKTTQQVTLNSLTQLQVCDKIGNISVTVDPNASQATVTTQKIVQAASQNDANQAFKQLIVEVQPPTTIQHPLTCSHFATSSSNSSASSQPAGTTLTVNTTIPDNNDISSDNANRVDITITLPSTVLQSGPDRIITVESSVGNIEVDNLTGLFNIRGSTGNVTVQNAYLTPGSDIETGQGNITLNGRLITPTTPSASQQSFFRLSSEKGNIDVTLPDTTNVTLDTSTNSGTIKSDFNNQIQNSGGSASIQGPLNASAGTPTSTLVINVSLGNITLHKA
jgi:hypothetical protein